MRKLSAVFTLCVMLVCCFIFAVSTRADVIFEPQDSFYETHREQCEYHNRSYTANGPNGDVKVYESPESDSVRATVSNGEELYVSHVYQDSAGTIWGFVEQWQAGVSGWVPMDYLELIYDEISFEQDFGDSFQSEEGTLSEAFAGKTIFFWEYPGSHTCYDVMVGENRLPEYQTVYVDGAGNRWGRVGYYMAMHGWINLDNPTADYDTLFPEGFGETQPDTQPLEDALSEPVEEIVPQSRSSTLTAVILTVSILAAAAVTAVLLVILKRKK